MKTTITSFPHTIEKCTYVRTLHDKPVRMSYQFALYEDKKGKKYVCKLWCGDTHDADRQGLENEIGVYRALRNISPSIQKTAAARFPRFVIPEMLAWKVSDSMVYLLIEYIPGTFLAQSNSKSTAVDIYAQASGYFQELSQSPEFTRALPQKRTALHFFILYHGAFVGALSRFPAQWQLIFSSLIPVYRGLLAMAIDGKMSFVHRDLGGYNNILLAKNRIVLIDYQISTLAHPLVELANVIATRKLDSDFTNAFFRSAVWKNMKLDAGIVTIFRSLLLYGAIYNVQVGNPTEARASLDMMKRALSL